MTLDAHRPLSVKGIPMVTYHHMDHAANDHEIAFLGCDQPRRR